MFRKTAYALVILMGLSAIMGASPLPLIPEEKRETTIVTKSTATRESTASTEQPAATTATQTARQEERVIEDTEEESAAAVVTGSSDIITTIEKGHEGYFTAQDKSSSPGDTLAGVISKEGDYRSKAKKAAAYLRGTDRAGEAGEATAADFRAAFDALHHFDYTYK